MLYSHQISIVVKISVTLNSVGDGVEFENALNNTCCLNKHAWDSVQEYNIINIIIINKT